MRAHRSAAILLAAGALSTTAACGSSGGSTSYTAAATRGCLTGKGARVSTADADFIAQDAINGGYQVTIGKNNANVSFYRSGGDAGQAMASYKVTAKAFGINPSGNELYSRANAVIAWDNEPTDRQRSTVDDCLS
jgi:hypothetical protein